MDSKIEQALPTTRRGFLQLGLMGTATLALGSTVATLTGCATPLERNSTFKFLKPDDRALFAAIIPQVLSKSFPGDLTDKSAMRRVLLALDDVIYTLQYNNRHQMRMMFDALALAPIRVIAGASWADWEDMSPKQVNDFLNGWRDSSIQLKRMGYVSLTKLINISWYSQPESFASTGYPGPPVKIPTPVSPTLSSISSITTAEQS